MGLSRLDNFLKSTKGEILYVDPSSLDSTDSIENRGNSLARPFKTLQRALIEAARFSYQIGENNDRFGKTTILLYPGEHIVDNRPGWIPISENTYRLRSGTTSINFSPFNVNSNFDLDNADNQLYKLNSVYGGVIIPRGTSIVGLDLRKTKIIPKYVPNPENDDIERSAIFRVTGACYFWQFSIFDADPSDVAYKDYTNNVFVPNFSHHKLTCFEYADGVNPVVIDDEFISNYRTDRTDLDIYYEKVGLAYGTATGRDISPDFPLDGIDIEPKIDEYRIVGSTGAEVGITSIKSGDGITPTTVVTVTIENSLEGLEVNTPIRIEGIAESGYDGQYAITEKVSDTQFKYQVSNIPTDAAPSTTSGATLNISVDTVTSASPYIFNVSLRSVYGVCGMHADGNKATGFKSMVVAQFTGIGLQKDDNAFVKYNTTSGSYEDKNASGNENIHTDSRARYKPSYENFHVKCSNNALLQIVSVFAIGFNNHFVAESGGDQSITNSNSNFGSRSLVSRGYRKNAFSRDDIGYISHILSPRENEQKEESVEFIGIDVGVSTSVGTATTSKLFLYNETNLDIPPSNVIDGYRIGSRKDEFLKVLISDENSVETFSSKVVMPNTEDSSRKISEKIHLVSRTNNINDITSNTLTLEEDHTFINGESIRIISESGSLPDGIENNKIYYAITEEVAPNPAIASNEIRIASTFNDAINDVSISINNLGGVLSIVSRVSDKSSGDIGHPIQFDDTNGQWYINVSTASTENTIYNTLWERGVNALGESTPRTFILRKPNDRKVKESLYKLRYVLPKDSATLGRPPIEGFVLQESNNIDGENDSEVEKYLSFDSETLNNSTQFRKFKFIADASWDTLSKQATIRTEVPHQLSIDSQVEIENVLSSFNNTGIADSGYNGTFSVVDVLNRKEFKISVENNPGDFLNDTSTRNQNLPKFKKKKYSNTYVIFDQEEIQPYIQNEQDGVYHITILNASNNPEVSPFNDIELLQPLENLYPELDRDNPNSDPEPSRTYATRNPIGKVVINDPEKSITKETLVKNLEDNSVGFGVTNIISNSSTNATSHTIYTDIEHGLNRIVSVEIVDEGSGYGSGGGVEEILYNARLVGSSGSITGSDATSRIKVSSSGTITDIEIIDGGSAYGIGNTLSVTGVAFTTGYSEGYVRVTGIYTNTNDSFTINGVDQLYGDYNTTYKIDSISVGQTNSFTAISGTVVGFASTGVGVELSNLSNAYGILNGSSWSINAANYTPSTGIVTFTLSSEHGLSVNDKILISGCTGDSDLYNGEHIIKRTSKTDLDELSVDVGIGTQSISFSGTPIAYQLTLDSKGGTYSIDNESFSGRITTLYGNLTAKLATALNRTSSTIEITDLDNYDLEIGDYLLIDDEIIRVSQTVTGNPVNVFRGILGTKSASHVQNSVIRRINPIPIELRRHSIIRASGHTFEYLGYGPGNYSTAFPDRQDRKLSSSEEILSQSFTENGGFVVYTGMNSDGDFYVSNRRVIKTNGEEEVFSTPYPRFRGESKESASNSLGENVIKASEINISDAIRIEGGDEKTTVSQFDGPTIFTNKITSTSPKGVETTNLYLQGEETVSRKYTVGISNPVSSVELIGFPAGNPGDIIFNGNPAKTKNAGWIYTTDNDWYPFAGISRSTDAFSLEGDFYGTFYGDGSNLTNVSDIWTVDSIGIHTNALVGFGTTNSAKAGVAMYCQGNAEITGTMKVYEIIENTTINNTPGAVTGTLNFDLKYSSIFYFTQDATSNWTVNFRADAVTTLASFLNVGDSLTVAVTTKQGPTAYYNNVVQIDGVTISPKYYGSLTINSGNSNSLDLYTYVIVKKSNTGTVTNDFDVLYSQSQYS